MRGFLLLLAALPVSGPAIAHPLTCTWAKAFQCDMDAACKPMKSNISVALDLAAKSYRRCNDHGCTSYAATISQFGPHMTKIEGKGFALELDQNGKASETNRLDRSVVMSQGTCR
jgi:hypothetical protein